MYLSRDEAGSAGVPVHRLTCSAAGDIAVAPRRVVTGGSDTGVVAVKVTLNAEGIAITEAAPEEDEEATVELRVVAYVGEAAGSCAALPAGAVHDEVVLAVKRRSP